MSHRSSDYNSDLLDISAWSHLLDNSDSKREREMRVCNCDSMRKGGRERLRESVRGREGGRERECATVTLCEREGESAAVKRL